MKEYFCKITVIIGLFVIAFITFNLNAEWYKLEKYIWKNKITK